MRILIYSLRWLALVNSTLQSRLGRSLAWLILAMTVIESVIVAARFGADMGSTAVQESVSYLHAIVFMLCLGYAAEADAHVRVDIFYRKFSALGQAWVNLIGSLLLLLPYSLFMLFISWDWALQSWHFGEGSINPGGLPFVYVLKMLVPAAASLLTLHALASSGQQLLKISFVEGGEH